MYERSDSISPPCFPPFSNLQNNVKRSHPADNILLRGEEQPDFRALVHRHDISTHGVPSVFTPNNASPRIANSLQNSLQKEDPRVLESRTIPSVSKEKDRRWDTLSRNFSYIGKNCYYILERQGEVVGGKGKEERKT